jgi:tRNA(Ile)-lysidine synthase
VHAGDLLARCDFPAPGTPVNCAVSGGADSMALVVLAHAAGLVVTAHHVDHGLRPTSTNDATVIARLTDRLGIDLVVHTVHVGDGPNLEARAREARYGALPDDAMTAHTADDQAETVLINLLRGSSARGLAAMRPGARRPLLALRRADTHAICRDEQIDLVDDETNRDPRFLRNRVRSKLLPLIADISRRDPVPVLVRNADLLRDDDDLLESLAASLDPTDALALAAAPLPLARRAVRRWLADPLPPDLATIDRVLAVARGEVPGCDVGRGRQIRRSKQRLSLQ